jgi:2-dehydro-3-deoxyphosphogluconate aldolase/(4S)-4-hydroxy-2-oxoglutarate aldolase
VATASEQLEGLNVVPVISLDNAEEIIPLGKTLSNNGLPVAE